MVDTEVGSTKRVTRGNALNNAIKTGDLQTGAVTTAKVADGAVTAPKMASAVKWWEEIGRTTLGSAGTTITVSALPARRYLRLHVFLTVSAATVNGRLRFNNDTGNNYAYRASTDMATPGTVTSQNNILTITGSSNPVFMMIDVLNLAAYEKMVKADALHRGGIGPTVVPTGREIQGKWTNSADAISRIDLVTDGGGNYDVGSEIVVLGHD